MRMLCTAILVVGLSVCGAAAQGSHGGQAQIAPRGDVTLKMQGDQSAWINNDHMRRFYALSQEALGKSAPPLDFVSYREKSYVIFRAFGTSMGGDPEMMVDHLKDIPGQMVDIVKDDPEVLDSYDNFVVALMGPQ